LCNDVLDYQHFGGTWWPHLPSSTLTTESARTSEAMVTYHINTRCYKPQDHDRKA